MSERMNIPYENELMEVVRNIAKKHFNKLISEFVNDLIEWDMYNLPKLIKKWKERIR